jgi:hypothetical protein
MILKAFKNIEIERNIKLIILFYLEYKKKKIILREK